MSDPESITTVVVRRESLTSVLPAIIIETMSPFAIILVRALRVYLQTAVGLMTTGALANDLIPAAAVLGHWRVAASLAVGPALVCAAQNSLELLARLDEKMPQLRP